jgi:hypothetical protein
MSSSNVIRARLGMAVSFLRQRALSSACLLSPSLACPAHAFLTCDIGHKGLGNYQASVPLQGHPA